MEIKESIEELASSLKDLYDSVLEQTFKLRNLKPELCESKEYLEALENLNKARRRLVVAINCIEEIKV